MNIKIFISFAQCSPDSDNNEKSPASLVQLRRAEVEKIGLTSTSFGINLSPDNCNNRKSPKRGFFIRGEDRARTDDLLTASQAL